MILAKSKSKKRKAAATATNQDGLLSSSTTSSSKAHKSSSAAASMQQGMGQFLPSFMPAMGGYGQMMAPLSQSQFFQHAMMMGAQNSYRPQQQKQNHHMHQHSMQSVARSSSSSTVHVQHQRQDDHHRLPICSRIVIIMVRSMTTNIVLGEVHVNVSCQIIAALSKSVTNVPSRGAYCLSIVNVSGRMRRERKGMVHDIARCISSLLRGE